MVGVLLVSIGIVWVSTVGVLDITIWVGEEEIVVKMVDGITTGVVSVSVLISFVVSSVVFAMGTVLVVKNVFVDVNVSGIVDFVLPIEMIFEVTTDVELVAVKTLVVDEMVSTSVLVVKIGVVLISVVSIGVLFVTTVVTFGNTGTVESTKVSVVNGIVDVFTSDIDSVKGTVLVDIKVVTEVRVSGKVDLVEPIEIIVDVTGVEVNVIVMSDYQA